MAKVPAYHTNSPEYRRVIATSTTTTTRARRARASSRGTESPARQGVRCVTTARSSSTGRQRPNGGLGGAPTWTVRTLGTSGLIVTDAAGARMPSLLSPYNLSIDTTTGSKL